MVTRAHDDRTVDIFDVPVARGQGSGLDLRADVSSLVSGLLKGRDREIVAARMSEIAQRDISKPMLDGYASPARDTFNMPMALAPVLEVATSMTLLTEWLAETRGGRFLTGPAALAGEIVRLERLRTRTNRKLHQLRKRIGAST